MVSLRRLVQAAREGCMEGGLGVPVASLSLDQAIARFTSAGYKLVSRGEMEAHLTRKSTTSFWQLLATCVISAGGVAGLGWALGDPIHFRVLPDVPIAAYLVVLIYLAAKKPHVIHLRATRDGHAAVDLGTFPIVEFFRKLARNRALSNADPR